MERLGLVASIEKQLERDIGAGRLPEDGKLASEQTLARRYGVSRTTIREALGRLAARGLVVQRAGCKTRAVALDESVTLENLGVALHGESRGHPDRQRLLEGYFALKREATLELLAACREHASTWEMQRLGDACFALMEAARWEERWVAREFELLRLAARVAQRPGHLLLIQSLERAWWGIQARVQPHLDAHAVYQWAYCLFRRLDETDPVALRRELLPLLRACDERVLERLAPVREADDTPRPPRTPVVEPALVETEIATEAAPDAAVSNLSACRTGSCDVAPEEASPPGPAPVGSCGQPEDNPGTRGEHSPITSLEGSRPVVPAGEHPPAQRPPPRAGTLVWRECRQGLAWPIDPSGGETSAAGSEAAADRSGAG